MLTPGGVGIIGKFAKDLEEEFLGLGRSNGSIGVASTVVTGSHRVPGGTVVPEGESCAKSTPADNMVKMAGR